MNNYIFVNAPQKSDMDRLIKKLENAVASSIIRQLKNESTVESTYKASTTVSDHFESRVSGIC